VRLAAGTLACGAAGTDGLLVMSHHHQGVAKVGEGLTVSGWSVDDDIVEAIELPDRRFALGVVWHPEEDETSEIIPALVDAARAAVPYAGLMDKRNSQE
jgi:putative glutamine amidotransferase